MRGTGDQLITQDSYAVDSIRPKCIELQRMCDQYKSLLRRRREMLNKSHDLQDRIDKVRGQRFLRFQPTVGSSCIPVFLFYVNSVILPFRIKLNIRYKKSWASIFFCNFLCCIQGYIHPNFIFRPFLPLCQQANPKQFLKYHIVEINSEEMFTTVWKIKAKCKICEELTLLLILCKYIF